MEEDIRPVVGVIVATNSPLGRAAEAANDLNRHLPAPSAPGICPTCAGRFWPCAYFDDAAARLHTARLRLSDLVPLDLHPRLWPLPPPAVTPEVAWPQDPGPGEGDRHG
ncbi:hypothetical protein [Amycolatopsis iheyensis]|uniref:hypothetical protein n=1 Tax=Amycolatopsis iheyensis TaxID=2945988 RepID=UPI00215268A8|nr:hypothetical protein [Amycolatopsis iheyensis]